MKTINIALIAALLLCSTVAWAVLPEVIFFGDSIMAQQKWSKYWDIPVENKAVPESKVRNITNVAERMLDTETYFAVFEGGINDILQGRHAEAIAIDYEAMIVMAKKKAPNARIFIISVLPTLKGYQKNNEIIKFNRLLVDIAAKQGATFIDLHQDFVDIDGITARKDLVRNVHLWPAGQQLLADKLQEYVY